MAYHGVVIPETLMATNIDSLNRSVVSASAIDNGMVFVMGGKSTTAGETEVFSVTWNTTASPLGLWMAYNGEEIVLTEARYKGINPDPRYFVMEAGKVSSAFKPQVGDIVLMTADALTGSYSAGSTTHAIAVANDYKLNWATAAGTGTAFKLLAKKYISLATGAIDSQRIDAFEFECIAN